MNRKLILASLGLGLAARLSQYLFNRSLWLDEAFLAMNILKRDWPGLLLPLDDNQIAPPGFLLAEKLAVAVLGQGEYALRLAPLLAGLAAVFILYRIAKTQLNAQSALLGASLLGWSQPVIYFASELKPYSTDVMLTAAAYALVWPALRAKAVSRERMVVLALAGALVVWFSYPAVFVLAAIGAALLAGPLVRREAGQLGGWLAVLLAWGASLAVLYWAVLRYGFANEFLRAYWTGAFVSFPPRSLSDLYWFAQLFFDFMVQSVGMPFYGVATFAWLVGLVTLFKEQRWQPALALALPLAFAMTAAALRLYPFYGRTLLFAVPPTVLLMAKGAQAIYVALAKNSKTTAAIFIGVLLFHPFYRTVIVFPQPLVTEETRPVIEHIHAHWQPGDRIYVYHGAARPFEYYAPRYGLQDTSLYYVSTASNGDFSILAQDIEKVRGTRVWFLFSHIYSFNGISEESFTLDQLKTFPRLDAFAAPGATVYLYDLR